MNKKEKVYLEEVYKDCVSLERRKDLTEFGAGQGMLCCILLKKKRKRPFRVETVKRIKCNDCKKTYNINNDERCVFCDSKNLKFLRK